MRNEGMNRKQDIKVHHIGMWARDMDAAVRFYKNALGFEKVREYEVPKEVMKAVFGIEEACKVQVYGGESITVELFDGSKHQRSGLNHIAITVDDKKAFCDRAKLNGGKVIEVWRQDHYIYFVEDPSGTLIEVKD
jgi:catechol 2,3-dioxygenase-like lactoylglutathione lyase family enzyme